MFRVVELPQQQHICKVKSLNKGDANSEVTVYYEVRPHPEPAATVCSSWVLIQSFSSLFIKSGPKALREHTLMELLVVSAEGPCLRVSVRSAFPLMLN